MWRASSLSWQASVMPAPVWWGQASVCLPVTRGTFIPCLLERWQGTESKIYFAKCVVVVKRNMRALGVLHLLRMAYLLGAGMALWWEHSPPTSVVRVRFPELTPYEAWVCCWFSSLFRGISSLHKKQHFQISIPLGNSGWIATLWFCHWKFSFVCLFVCLFIYLFIYLFIHLFIYTGVRLVIKEYTAALNWCGPFLLSIFFFFIIIIRFAVLCRRWRRFKSE